MPPSRFSLPSARCHRPSALTSPAGLPSVAACPDSTLDAQPPRRSVPPSRSPFDASRLISDDPRSWDLSRRGLGPMLPSSLCLPSLRSTGCFPRHPLRPLVVGVSPLDVPSVSIARHTEVCLAPDPAASPGGIVCPSPYRTRCVFQHRAGRFPLERVTFEVLTDRGAVVSAHPLSCFVVKD